MLNCDWDVLFYIVLDQHVMILVVLELLIHSIEALLQPVSLLLDVFYLGELQALPILLFLHAI